MVGALFNAWEALSIFGVANVIAYISGLDAIGYWFSATMAGIVARFFHGVLYIVNIPVLRVVCFIPGLE